MTSDNDYNPKKRGRKMNLNKWMRVKDFFIAGILLSVSAFKNDTNFLLLGLFGMMVPAVIELMFCD